MICLICGENKHDYLYVLHGISLWQCPGCGLVSSQLHVSDEEALRDYQNRNESFPVATEGRTEVEASKRYLEILKNRSPNATRIIVLAKPQHVFSKVAKELGLHIVQHLTISEFENKTFTEETVDAVVFIYQLERSLFPQNVLNKAHDLLKPGGILLVVTPSLDSRSARFFRNAWTEWRPENLYYFDNTTIQSLLWKCNFNKVILDKDLRSYTLDHINDRAAGFPKTWITRIIKMAYRVLPSSLHGIYFRLPTSGRVISAKKAERRSQQVLSIVLPVYNESSTFPKLIQHLTSKQLDCIDKEIIIVESNSTDNSRQLVMAYKDFPSVKIILQDKPRGKGYAVRQGFEQASGDVLMIQDADLEYDLNDYDALLEPVATYKKPFVLGSRHGGRWKMRHFNEQEHISAYFNFGHKLFTTLINVLYGHFDFELVIKLIRKGYIPLEIPVNYNSRSFKEGKKVNMFRDPFTWIKASFKYRFAKITKDVLD
jgi:SAM-dependent methyltransferase